MNMAWGAGDLEGRMVSDIGTAAIEQRNGTCGVTRNEATWYLR